MNAAIACAVAGMICLLGFPLIYLTLASGLPGVDPDLVAWPVLLVGVGLLAVAARLALRQR